MGTNLTFISIFLGNNLIFKYSILRLISNIYKQKINVYSKIIEIVYTKLYA